jgi:hypothetical protein
VFIKAACPRGRSGLIASVDRDFIEAYGGQGKGNPNHPGYSLVTHYWGQKNSDGSEKKALRTFSSSIWQSEASAAGRST